MRTKNLGSRFLRAPRSRHWRPSLGARNCSFWGCTRISDPRSLTWPASNSPRGGSWTCMPPFCPGGGSRCPNSIWAADSGGGFGVSYVPGDDPLPVAELASGLAEVVAKECADLGVDMPHISIEPGRAIAGPSTFTIYEVGTVKPVETDEGLVRTYVSVRSEERRVGKAWK